MVKNILILCTLVIYLKICKVNSEASPIEHSFDLDCDFDKNNLCLWRNSNSTWEHTSDWTITTTGINITSTNKMIVPMSSNNAFIYTNGTNNGLNTALLISNTVLCQLGGAEIKYWYYKTQINSRLEICIRQPPGSINFLHQKCYDGVQSVQANQWVYQKIELPPVSQQFEILIRAYFIHPDDIIAIDGISYEAVLCGSTYNKIDVITVDKWNIIKQDINNDKEDSKPMLIIADSLNPKNYDNLKKEESILKDVPIINDKNDVIKNLTKINNDPLPKLIDMVHDVSPLISMLWKSIQQPSTVYQNAPVTSITDVITNAKIPIQAKASKTLQINSLSSNLNNYNENNNELMINEVPINDEIKKNIYVAKIGKNRSLKKLPTKNIYPPSFKVNNQIIKSTTIETTTIDFTTITPINNLYETTKNIEQIYPSKSFQIKKRPIIRPKTVFEQDNLNKNIKINETVASPNIENTIKNYTIFTPSQSISHFNQTSSLLDENSMTKNDEDVNFLQSKLSNLSMNVDDISKYLTPDMINELQLLSNFDDLESLTEGMDLSLLSKPGGFNILREQFLEKLLEKKLDKEISKPFSVIQGSNKDEAGFLLDDEYKSFGAKTYVKGKEKNNFDYDHFFIEPSLCSSINCDFNNNNICEWISLNEDSDIELILPMYEMNFREWLLGENSIGNSVTGIIDMEQKRKNYVYAGDTNNPNDIFILTTKNKVSFKETSRILFDFYHAGIHGELKICLDSFINCPFIYSSNNLTSNSRSWQKGEIIIPKIGIHRILIFANGLYKNYFIGLDNIRLAQINALKPATC